MKYSFYLYNERLPFLIDAGVTYKVIKTDGHKSLIEVEISFGSEILNIFHAGINCGYNAGTKSLNKTA